MLNGLRTTAKSAVAIALCSAVIMSTGCTPQQQQNTKAVVQKIVTYEPEVASAVDTVASVVATLAPADAALIAVGQTSFDLAANALNVALTAYLATPNTGTLNSINIALQQLLAANASQFLAAAHISNPNSVAIAKTAIAGVRTILLLMDGLLAQSLPPATVAANAQARLVKVADIAPYLTAAERQQVEQVSGHSFGTVVRYETAQGF